MRTYLPAQEGANLRGRLENWQIQWAERRGIRVGAPPRKPASQSTGYVGDLNENLFEPLSGRVLQQFIAAKGGELDGPNGQSGNMYAVYSSSALCVNFFHFWSRLIEAEPETAKRTIGVMLKACGLSPEPVKCINFETEKVVSPYFHTHPHLDLEIVFEKEAPWTCVGIEAKFCEPYDGKQRTGLHPVYVRGKKMWQDWTNTYALAQTLTPNDRSHSYLHAAQLLKHLLGLRKQDGSKFLLVYLWFDVSDRQASLQHRREIDAFGEVLRSDNIPFISRTYQEVLRTLESSDFNFIQPYVHYLRERYMGNMVHPDQD